MLDTSDGDTVSMEGSISGGKASPGSLPLSGAETRGTKITLSEQPTLVPLLAGTCLRRAYDRIACLLSLHGTLGIGK